MRHIDEQAIASVLKMADLIPAMRQAMINFSHGHITQPTRRIFEVPDRNGFFASMPSAGANGLGAKLVSVYPENAKKGLHTHMAVIVLFSPETGEPMVMMDGRLITEMRTAAVTATFIDAVAGSDVKTLAILGAGVQAKSHIQAMTHVRAFGEIRIWNRTPARAEKLAAHVGGKAMSCEQAVRGADVVVATTGAKLPILDGKWLHPGAKVASVGWASPDAGELDADTMSHVVVVDSREGVLTESGNIRAHDAEIYAELGEVLDGSRLVNMDDTIVFESIGMACQDIAAATLVYKKLAG